MQKEILKQMLLQNKMDCTHFCKNITSKNTDYRLTPDTASVGFLFRHIGETTNLIAQFLGYETDIIGTTIGKKDTGIQYDLEASQGYFEKGYDTLKKLVDNTSDSQWLEEIDTAWFGRISRIKLFSILLFHNSHHCGQISSSILHGGKKSDQ